MILAEIVFCSLITLPLVFVLYQENIKGLAKLHKVCPKKVGLSDFGKSGNYFLRQFSRWSVQYENSKTEFKFSH